MCEKKREQFYIFRRLISSFYSSQYTVSILSSFDELNAMVSLISSSCSQKSFIELFVQRKYSILGKNFRLCSYK